MHLSALVFKKKTLFYFLLFCIVVGGVLAYDSISKLEDPEIQIMQARVITIYPGASAHDVEMQVTSVLENELSALADINTILSKSAANVSMITVELKMTVPQKEIQQRWDFMRRKVEAAQAKLPEGVQPPMVIDDFGDVYGMFYGLTANGYSYQEMYDYARLLKSELLEVEGVRRVEIYGQQTPVVDVMISVEKMGELGVFPIQIMSAIAGQNQMVYPGTLESGNQRLRVQVNDQLKAIGDLQELIIQGIDGEQFRLGDIATIEKGYSQPLRNTLFVNNEKALGLSLSMESGENIIKLGERVDERMNELLHELPAGFEAQKIFFQPDKVRDSVHGFMWNLIASVLIVIVVLMLTMGLRGGIIIGTGLILTILATFPILLAADGTLQRISLGAFIVAMGMLVDNAIVVLDGIIVDLQKGVKRKKALINPAKRTAIPLLGATLIAVSAFLPVYLSKDTAGTYARDLFIVLCISLLVSWILALTQVPLFSEKFLKIKKSKQNTDPYTSRLYRTLRSVLAFLMTHKIATVAATTVLMALSIYNFKNIKQTFFPDFNYNQVYVEYKMPDGTSPSKVNEDLQLISNDLLQLEEVKMVVSSQGMTPTRYSLVRAMGEASDSYGELIVNFDDYETMVKMKPVISRYLHENFPDAQIRIRKYNLSIKSSHTVEVEFTGPDPAVLRNLSEQAQAIMRANPYTDKYTISDNWEPMAKSMVAKYDQTLARRTGTSRSDVSNALLAASEGLPVGKYYEGETAYTIKLRTMHSDGTNIEQLDDIPVWNMLPNLGTVDINSITEVFYGSKSQEELTKEIVSPVPLSAISRGIEMEWDESVVHRTDGKRSIEAQCDPADQFSPALTRKTMLKEMKAIELPDGYQMKWLGEYDLQKDALTNIFSYMPIAIMLIILILILLFNDLRKPFIVLACIPLAAIGIVPGMILAGSPFTFIAIIGTFGLMGMLIKNSIVLLDEIEKQIVEGSDRFSAVINATIARTRPVILASLTTMLGMLPLFRDPMYSSMAVAVISGLLVGTLITLVFVPILYAVLFKVDRSEYKGKIERL
ncbi:efflux RND transporter permease subunit [Roseimarinus sediminis]|uniref:efflux RND transporter permease subunit n=1 Tax=Roseimarinus sediminis TaxID=1610899 RepID=UPI003D1EED5C